MGPEPFPQPIPNLLEQAKLAFLCCATIQEMKAVELPGKEVFSIDVSDPEKWKSAENEENLLRLFRELCFGAFEQRDNPRSYNLPNPETKKIAIADLAEIKKSQNPSLPGNSTAFISC